VLDRRGPLGVHLQDESVDLLEQCRSEDTAATQPDAGVSSPAFNRRTSETGFLIADSDALGYVAFGCDDART
jgi:hypothetical protein